MFRPLVAYAGFSFVLLQVVNIIFPALRLPIWTETFVVILVLFGFPITIFFAWMYDITPSGIKKTSPKKQVDPKSKKILLPITGFLTVVGFSFWVWYSLGSLSQGSEIDNKIFKSIAVMYLDNHSSNIEDDNLCSALTDGIITSLSKLGIFSIKSRTDVLKFRKKVTSHEEIESALRVDAYIEGSIIKSSDNKNYLANIQLIDVKNGNNLWAGNYEKTVDEILYIPDLIATDVSAALGMVISSNIITPAVSSNINNKTFSLLGEGLNLLDGGEYKKSVAVFDSLLKIEPNNMKAVFSRGRAFEQLKNYPKAINAYEQIIPLDQKLSHATKIWSHPDINNQTELEDIKIYNKYLVSKKHRIQIILSDVKDESQEIFAINLKTNEQLWKKSLLERNPSSIIVDDNLFLFSSTIGEEKREATIYAYNIKNGKQLFTDEIPRKHLTARVMPNIIKPHVNSDSILTNMIFLNVRRDEAYELVMFDTEKLNIKWKYSFPLKTVEEGEPLLYLIESGNNNFVFHSKGSKMYLLSATDGSIIWENSLKEKNGRYLIHNDKIVLYSKDDYEIRISNIIDQKLISKHDDLKETIDSVFIFDNNIIVQTNKSIVSLQSKSRLFRSMLNWYLPITHDIISTRIILNNIFVLTRNGDLYCIKGEDGQIKNRTQVNNYTNVTLIHDNSNKGLIIFDGSFITGLDPNTGGALYKIRKIPPKCGHITKPIFLSNNRMLLLNFGDKKGEVIIETYNRNTGELLWVTNEKLWTVIASSAGIFELLGGGACACHFLPFWVRIDDNNQLYMMTRAGGLFKVDLSWTPEKNYIPKTNLFNRLAYSYIQNNNFDAAEKVLDKILSKFDQQNEEAFVQMSNLYRANDDSLKFINIQSEYYDLVRYNDLKRLAVEEELIKYADLKWINSFPQKQDFASELNESMILTGRCEENYGCILSAFRKKSSVEVWGLHMPMEKKCMHFISNNKNLSFVGKQEKDGQYKYTLYNYNINDGDENWRSLLWDDSSTVFIDKVYDFSTTYIIDYFKDNNHYIRAINSITGDFIWENKLDSDPFLRSKNTNLILGDDFIIVPMGEHMVAWDLFSGEEVWDYEFDDFEYIEYVAQHSLSNNILSFLSEDDEFFMMDLNNREVIYSNEIDFENKLLLSYLDNNKIVGYVPTGQVYVYQLNDNKIRSFWNEDYSRNIEILNVSKNTIYIEDKDDNKILSINFTDTNKNTISYTIWKPSQIIINEDIYSCLSNNKLYTINY